jgi:hypothetical protein
MNWDQKYNREDFRQFLRSFLPNDFDPHEEEINLDSTGRIKSCLFLGESESLDLYVYEFEHESERDPRITITKEIFRFMRYYLKDNILAIVKSSNSKNYRLSLVTKDYILDEKGAKTQLSNPRRYSFFLGPQAKIKTPKRFLEEHGPVKNFEDLKSRFSVEVVNREFYEKISNLFRELVRDIKLPDDADEEKKQNFAVRLIGRTIFCWFLKKKTLNGNPLIPDEILSTNAIGNKKGYDYFHTIVENLFFQVLNTPIKERKIKEFNDVPFLNGGLFEPKSDDYYEFDEGTQLSRYINTVKISNDWFNRFFDVLETYNFTIDESTPFDVELSVDPEMLGRIFENLLAEINPETEESARHATGSYYTPRQIVDYMVNESLKQCLVSKTAIDEQIIEDLLDYHKDAIDINDEAKEKIVDVIDNLKIIDPACGSGAFLMGTLQQLLLVLHKVDPDASRWRNKQLENLNPLIKSSIEDKLKGENEEFIRKLGLIEKVIYGVDIQEIAIEIAKLRVFLSLVVDSQIDDKKENVGIKPLPNLEFKFVCADTLRKFPEGQITFSEDQAMIEELKRIREKYFISYGPEKQKLEDQFRKVQNDITKDTQNWPYENKIKMLSNWEPFSSKPSDWFDPEWMFGVKDGFDIVIGNPPYIQLQRKQGKLAQRYEDQNFTVYTKKGDIYTLFYERGLQLLKENGYLCFITSNKWMRAGYGERLREFFLRQNPLILIDLGPNVFESATVDTNILLIQKSNNKHQLKGISLKSKIGSQDLFNLVKTQAISIQNMNKEVWFIGNNAEQKLKGKIESIGKSLRDWDVSIYYGIKTGLNEAFIIDNEKREEILANCKDEKERKRTEAIIKPILRGRDIKRYHYEWADLWVIVIPAGWTNENRMQEKPEIFIEKSFPTLMQYLKPFESKASQRDDKGDYWWELRHCAYYSEFEKEKVVWGNISYNSQFSYVEKSIFVNAPANMIISNKVSIKFLVGVMNSKIFDREFKRIGIFLGHAYEWKKQYIEQVKIPPIIPDNEPIVKQIEKLVDKIIDIKNKNHEYDTTDLEKEIDKLIYKLYDLTEKEIALIEDEQ